jgi:hypothetical protein
MKKTPFIVILLGMTAFMLTQNCNPGRNEPGPDQPLVPEDTVYKTKEKIYEPKETVEIYLASIKQKDENGDTTYHLALFDANGDYAVDSLTTIFFPENSKPGQIKWKKVHKSGIKEIVEIKYAGEGKPVIFRSIVSRLPGDEWKLDLTEDLLKFIGDSVVIEKYIIRYIPVNENDTVSIDPYLRVNP